MGEIQEDDHIQLLPPDAEVEAPCYTVFKGSVSQTLRGKILRQMRLENALEAAVDDSDKESSSSHEELSTMKMQEAFARSTAIAHGEIKAWLESVDPELVELYG